MEKRNCTWAGHCAIFQGWLRIESHFFLLLPGCYKNGSGSLKNSCWNSVIYKEDIINQTNFIRVVFCLVIFAGIAFLKLHKVSLIFSRFYPCLSLPSLATNDRTQFQCLSIV